MKTTTQSDFALTELRPSFDPGVGRSVSCLCNGWNWGSWNAASKLVVWESGQDACWCILMYLVSSCSREDHLFLRYDLWNVTWRQQYNLTLPLLSYDQALTLVLAWVSLVFATVGIEGLEMKPPSWSSESLVRMLADVYWCILWAVVAGRITCFFATISEMSHEDNNTIWLCPYWATTKLWPWCWHVCLLSLQRLELRVLKCSLQVGRLRVWSGCLLMYIDVSCEQL